MSIKIDSRVPGRSANRATWRRDGDFGVGRIHEEPKPARPPAEVEQAVRTASDGGAGHPAQFARLRVVVEIRRLTARAGLMLRHDEIARPRPGAVAVEGVRCWPPRGVGFEHRIDVGTEEIEIPRERSPVVDCREKPIMEDEPAGVGLPQNRGLIVLKLRDDPAQRR